MKKSTEPDTDNTLFHLSHIGQVYSFKAVSVVERSVQGHGRLGGREVSQGQDRLGSREVSARSRPSRR